jgi:hypothetical protein
MNFAGHIEVARLIGTPGSEGPDLAGFLLGSALPDFAAIGQFRLIKRPTDRAVAAGVDIHHRTDNVFHFHPWFRHHSSTVSSQLHREADVSRGAAMACGHVGVELLLDGHLLSTRTELRPLTQAVVDQTRAGTYQLDDLVAEDRRDDWLRHRERLAGWEVPDDYHRPDRVARMLWRILSRRERLSFTEDRIEPVANILAEHQEEIIEGSAVLLNDLVDDVG